MITVPLFKRHRILSQVAGHGMHVVKFLPPLHIGEEDRQWIASACTDVIADSHQVTGAIWDLGKQLAGAAVRMKAGGG
jgi:ornithine--oxo-acid transaminase